MNIKKVISIVLAIIIATSCLTFSLSAEQSQIDPFDPETFPTIEEQYQEMLSNPNLTNAKRQDIMESYNRIMAIKNGYSVFKAKAYVESCNLNVPYFAQENDHYCGPATVQQTYAFLNLRDNGTGYCPSQSDIAKALKTTINGTDQSKILDYINNTFNENYLVDWYFDEEEAESLMYNAMTEDMRPPILHVISWQYYPTDGHYMNVDAYNAEEDMFRVVDPNYDNCNSDVIYVTEAEGKYLVDVSDVNSVCDRMMI